MKLYDLVKQLLEDYAELRDSDKALMWEVWIREEKIWKGEFDAFGSISLDDFLTATSPESIRRCRQKIQELHPELKGSVRIERERKRIEKQRGTHIFRELI